MAPKGKAALKWERMNMAVLIMAAAVTVLMLAKDIWGLLYAQADLSMTVYRISVDVWLIGILPVTLYPFLGGKTGVATGAPSPK